MLENKDVQENSKTILIMRELSADEKMRYLAEMREKALHDEANAINSAEKRRLIVRKGYKWRNYDVKGRLQRYGYVVVLSGL